MAITYALAETREDKEAVYRFRYAVYVDEMGRYQGTADHENRRLAEPEDENSLIFFAREGDEVIATVRLTWGGHGFSDRQVHQYSLSPFLSELSPRRLAVGERAMVEPSHRGSGILDELIAHSSELVQDYDIRLTFGACEPHLLPLYLGMGQRTYAERNINSAEAGYLIPLVSFPQGEDALVGIGTDTEPDVVPACLRPILSSSGGAVHSPILLGPEEYWDEIRRSLHELEQQGISAFDGFSQDEISRCIGRSNVIDCDRGDRVLKKGGVARNIFVVLTGALEVREGDRLIGVVGEGEVFGEMAFLLDQPRSHDVYAATDGTSVLSLSEGTLRKMMADDGIIAAKLLLNVSKMLCLRLIRAA